MANVDALSKDLENVDLDKERTVDFFAGAQFNDTVTWNGKHGWGVVKSPVFYFYSKKPSATGNEDAESMYNIEKAEVKEGDGFFTLSRPGDADIRLERESKDKLQELANVIKKQAQEASMTSITPEQEKIMQRVIERLAKEKNVTVESDDKHQTELVRFLKAKKWDEEKTIELYNDYRRWRQDFGIDNLKMKDVNREFMSGKCEVPGTTDKWGRPLVIFRPRSHEPGSSTGVSIVQMAAYIFEKILDTTPDQQLSVIVDMKGLSKENVDLRLPKTMYEIISYRYPSSVGMYMIVNQPLFFTTVYAVISSWLDAEMKNKVQMLGGNIDKLKNFIDPNNLPQDLGGNKEFNFRDWIRLRYKVEGWSFNKDEEKDTSQGKSVQARLVEALASEPAVVEVLHGAVKTGYLTKESGWMKRYQKQFFVLQQNIIYYYKDDKGLKPEGMIGLSNVKVENGESVTKKPHSFLIITTLRTYYVVASNDEEKDAWMDAIKSQIIAV